jgi:hypothetical protein
MRRAEIPKSSKWTSRFYLCCAAILFALGVWLLFAPSKARSQSLRDNGFAAKAGFTGWLTVTARKGCDK